MVLFEAGVSGVISAKRGVMVCLRQDGAAQRFLDARRGGTGIPAAAEGDPAAHSRIGHGHAQGLPAAAPSPIHTTEGIDSEDHRPSAGFSPERKWAGVWEGLWGAHL